MRHTSIDRYSVLHGNGISVGNLAKITGIKRKYLEIMYEDSFHQFDEVLLYACGINNTNRIPDNEIAKMRESVSLTALCEHHLAKSLRNYKKCLSCKEYKHQDFFNKKRKGKQARCKVCVARDRACQQTPEAKARKKAYTQSPEGRATINAYNQRPEVKAKRKAYHADPIVKAREKARNRARQQRPEVKAKAKARYEKKKLENKK